MTTTKIILYTHKILKGGKSPILLQLIKDRKIKKISLGFSAKPSQWNDEAKELEKGFPNFKKVNHVIHKKKAEIEDIIYDFERESKNYTLQDIENKFLNTIQKTTVFSYSNEIIDRLKESGKVGNAAIYKELLRSLKKFRSDKDLLFGDINFTFLNKYEEDFLKRGVQENAISVYMRTLRALYNKAIKEGKANEGDYPFKVYSVSKFNTETSKRALTKEDLLKIINYEVEGKTSKWHAKNYFIFSFYNVGINFADMARLRWSNILNGRIHYIRSKTNKHYDIKIQPRTQEILNLYSKRNKQQDDFIFPVLNDTVHNNPQSIKDRINKVNKTVNKDLKAIAIAAKIQNPETITHYCARHSWATIQKRNGTPVSVISESMGHDDEKTTKIYLDSFENEVLDEANANLL